MAMTSIVDAATAAKLCVAFVIVVLRNRGGHSGCGREFGEISAGIFIFESPTETRIDTRLSANAKFDHSCIPTTCATTLPAHARKPHSIRSIQTCRLRPARPKGNPPRPAREETAG